LTPKLIANYGSKTNQPIGKRNSVFVRRMETAIESNDWKKATDLFSQIANSQFEGLDELQADDIESIVQVLSANDRHREATNVIKQSKNLGLKLTSTAYSKYVELLARKGQIDRAISVIEELLQAKTPIQNSFYNGILTTLKNQGDWKTIHRLIQQMHEYNIPVPSRALRILLLSAGRARKLGILSNTMAFVEAKFPGDKMDTSLRTAMLQSFILADEPKNTVDMFEKIDSKWLAKHSNTVLLNTALQAYVKIGKLNQALKLLEKKMLPLSSNTRPDDFSFSCLMVAFAAKEEWIQVLKVYDLLRDEEVCRPTENLRNMLTHSTGLKALFECKQKDNKKFFDQEMALILARVDTTPLVNVNHVSTLVDTLIECKLEPHASDLFERIMNAKILREPNWLREGGFEVDLHTFSKGVARCAVIMALNQLKDSYVHSNDAHRDQRIQDLRIITGVGKRSKEFMQPVVASEVKQLLQDVYRPPLQIKRHPTNPGCLVVSSSSLLKWLTQKDKQSKRKHLKKEIKK
jgi:tetratricopeptide (TPR) repeat protein